MTAIRPLGRILRAAEAGLYNDAAGALAAARAEADALLAQARDEAAAEREHILHDAAETARNEVTRHLAEAAAQTARALDALAPALADAIADGVARILGERPAAELTAAATAACVSRLQDRAGVTVRVPPAHVTETRDALQGLGGPAVQVQADAALGDDECVVETQAGFVRAGAAAQLARLRDALQAAG